MQIASHNHQTDLDAVLASVRPTQALLGLNQDGMIATDTWGRIRYLNPAAERLMGYTLDQVHERPLNSILTIFNESTGQSSGDPVARCLESDSVVALGNHDTVVTCEGEEVPVAGTASPMRSSAGVTVGALLVLRDVTPTRLLMRRISYDVMEKGRGRLISARQFHQRVEQIVHGMTDLHQHALIFVHLEGVPQIDERFGGAAGDALLSQLTQRFLSVLRERDSLARLDTREFGVFLEHCPRRQALWIADQLRRSLRRFRFQWGGQRMSLGVKLEVLPIAKGASSDDYHDGLAPALQDEEDPAPYA
jgi:PAS domain S-box-containing protein/diguanylate cyclase (GGDEF)-like protein